MAEAVAAPQATLAPQTRVAHPRWDNGREAPPGALRRAGRELAQGATDGRGQELIAGSEPEVRSEDRLRPGADDVGPRA
jgi:hypothetical protein